MTRCHSRNRTKLLATAINAFTLGGGQAYPEDRPLSYSLVILMEFVVDFVKFFLFLPENKKETTAPVFHSSGKSYRLCLAS